MTSQDYSKLCRDQRKAYFAWQAAPAGQSAEALAVYELASLKLKEAQDAT